MSTLYGDKRIIYSHDQLRLSGPDDPVESGNSVEFTITNTGESTVELGCGSAWTIQRKSDNSWQELIWTTTGDLAGCSNPLGPGESQTTRLTLDRDSIEARIGGTIQDTFSAGQYRFILLGTDPFLAVQFHIE